MSVPHEPFINLQETLANLRLELLRRAHEAGEPAVALGWQESNALTEIAGLRFKALDAFDKWLETFKNALD